MIHCAAYTAVDAAEDNVDVCRKVNADGTRNIAEVCRDLDIKMMYISTDYVFDGQGTRPWEPDDERHPLNVYGQTKYEGELAVEELVKKFFIVRIAWVFGVNGKNFIKTMLRIGKERGAATVVDDQIGCPTYTVDLARLICQMVEQNAQGVFHATGSGQPVSWYDFARRIFDLAGKEIELEPISTAAYPTAARRPLNSRLDCSVLAAAGLTPLPEWQDALARYLQALEEEKV